MIFLILNRGCYLFIYKKKIFYELSSSSSSYDETNEDKPPDGFGAMFATAVVGFFLTTKPSEFFAVAVAAAVVCFLALLAVAKEIVV